MVTLNIKNTMKMGKVEIMTESYRIAMLGVGAIMCMWHNRNKR